MMRLITENIFYATSVILASYFLILIGFYLFLGVLGIIESRRRAWQGEDEDYPGIYFSSFVHPVSVIVPARNEEEWIRDCVLSVLNLNYPEFEVIVVNDGSVDSTLSVLNKTLDLKAIDRLYIKHYSDGQVREIFRSLKYPNVTVINKTEGFKKAGSINAGLNIAKHKYICLMDADTILEPNALLRVMAEIEREPDKVIGVGSYFGLVNGFDIKDGQIIKKRFSYNPIIAYQNLEYIRSFMGNRIGWSRFNAMPIIAGGFGVWRSDILYKLGGFSADFTCEDLEFTFRAHDYIVKNKKMGYKILMLPYPASWTEGPANVISLISQRNRWQRVVNETIWKYKHMAFNPKYGVLAYLTFPYYVFYEVIGVFVELGSIAILVCGWIMGFVDINSFLAVLFLMVISQTLVSLLSILAFMRNQRLFNTSYLRYLIVLSFFEYFWYRWLVLIGRILGMYSYSRKIRTFNQYARVKRKKFR